MDYTKGTKSNKVTLNIAHVHNALEPPEPGVSSVMIDGVSIHAIDYIKIEAATGVPTKCVIQFECEVAGKIDGKGVADYIKEHTE